MSLAQHIPNWPTVIIDGDWTDGATVLAAMEAMWGIGFRADLTYYVIVWEGPSDSDDWASYTITTGNTLAITTPFVSTPAAGTTVYITDIWFA